MTSAAAGFVFEELRKLNRDGDLVRLALPDSKEVLKEVRAGLLASGDPLNDVRRPTVPLGPAWLKARLTFVSAGDAARAAMELARLEPGSLD